LSAQEDKASRNEIVKKKVEKGRHDCRMHHTNNGQQKEGMKNGKKESCLDKALRHAVEKFPLSFQKQVHVTYIEFPQENPVLSSSPQAIWSISLILKVQILDQKEIGGKVALTGVPGLLKGRHML
jgi:DNA replicative helicase MCM subunit Mcm2 (Cdc46/Mcm family)